MRVSSWSNTEMKNPHLKVSPGARVVSAALISGALSLMSAPAFAQAAPAPSPTAVQIAVPIGAPVLRPSEGTVVGPATATAPATPASGPKKKEPPKDPDTYEVTAKLGCAPDDTKALFISAVDRMPRGGSVRLVISVWGESLKNLKEQPLSTAARLDRYKFQVCDEAQPICRGIEEAFITVKEPLVLKAGSKVIGGMTYNKRSVLYEATIKGDFQGCR